MLTRRLRSIGLATTVLAGLAGLAAAGCGDNGGGSAERFCGEIDENKELLTDPALVYSDDIEPLLEKYREIADLAPLAIEQEWRQLVSTYETASTVVLGDVQSEQTALAAAYQSEAAAVAVAGWLRANCAVDIGPLSTIVPEQAPPPSSTDADGNPDGGDPGDGDPDGNPDGGDPGDGEPTTESTGG